MPAISLSVGFAQGVWSANLKANPPAAIISSTAKYVDCMYCATMPAATNVPPIMAAAPSAIRVAALQDDTNIMASALTVNSVLPDRSPKTKPRISAIMVT